MRQSAQRDEQPSDAQAARAPHAGAPRTCSTAPITWLLTVSGRQRVARSRSYCLSAARTAAAAAACCCCCLPLLPPHCCNAAASAGAPCCCRQRASTRESSSAVQPPCPRLGVIGCSASPARVMLLPVLPAAGAGRSHLQRKRGGRKEAGRGCLAGQLAAGGQPGTNLQAGPTLPRWHPPVHQPAAAEIL